MTANSGDEVPDQSIAALQKCYTYAGAPASVEADPREGAPLERKLLHYGAMARRRVFCSALHEELASLTVRQALAAFLHAVSLREFIWFSFGQKNWQMLHDIMAQAADDPLRDTGPEVWDLFLVACLQRDPRGFTVKTHADSLIRRVDHLCKRHRDLWPGSALRTPLYDALRAHMTGEIGPARLAIAGIQGKDALCGPIRAAATVLAPEARPDADQGQLEIVRLATARNALILSCDERYFRLYFKAFAQSFFKASDADPTWSIHLHCIGFDPRGHPELDDFGASIGITLDRVEVPVSPANWRAAYCASARYLFVPLYMDHYENLMISDIDGIFRDRFDPSWFDTDQNDVVLSSSVFLSPMKQVNPLPWNAFAAGCTLFNPTAPARAFGSALSGYLAAIFQNDRFVGSPWFADQNALFYSVHDVQDRLKFNRFDRIPFTQSMDWRQFKGTEAKKRFLDDRAQI